MVPTVNSTEFVSSNVRHVDLLSVINISAVKPMSSWVSDDWEYLAGTKETSTSTCFWNKQDKETKSVIKQRSQKWGKPFDRGQSSWSCPAPHCIK